MSGMKPVPTNLGGYIVGFDTGTLFRELSETNLKTYE